MTPNRYLLLSAVLSFTAVVQAADPVRLSYQHWRDGDVDAALQLLHDPAAAGNERAQLLLAMIHRDRNHSTHDDRQAFRWYLRAAEQGVAEAQFEVGLMYEVGIGVASDPAEANYWYERAIDGGLCPADLDPLQRALTGQSALPSID